MSAFTLYLTVPFAIQWWSAVMALIFQVRVRWLAAGIFLPAILCPGPLTLLGAVLLMQGLRVPSIGAFQDLMKRNPYVCLER